MVVLASTSVAFAGPASATAKVHNTRITPAGFVSRVDNPFMPLHPGTVFTYRGQKDGLSIRNVVAVLRRTKTIGGVACTAVLDRVWVGGNLTERTWDWYAQDRAGSVWYFGESSHDLKGGKVVSTEGSWEEGVQGAQAGIVMQAHPRVGQPYRQEYEAGVAEDQAAIVAVGKRVVTTREWTRLEPGVVEYKYYSRGTGNIVTVMTRGGDEYQSLTSVVNFKGSRK